KGLIRRQLTDGPIIGQRGRSAPFSNAAGGAEASRKFDQQLACGKQLLGHRRHYVQHAAVVESVPHRRHPVIGCRRIDTKDNGEFGLLEEDSDLQTGVHGLEIWLDRERGGATTGTKVTTGSHFAANLARGSSLTDSADVDRAHHKTRAGDALGDRGDGGQRKGATDYGDELQTFGGGSNQLSSSVQLILCVCLFQLVALFCFLSSRFIGAINRCYGNIIASIATRANRASRPANLRHSAGLSRGTRARICARNWATPVPPSSEQSARHLGCHDNTWLLSKPVSRWKISDRRLVRSHSRARARSSLSSSGNGSSFIDINLRTSYHIGLAVVLSRFRRPLVQLPEPHPSPSQAAKVPGDGVSPAKGQTFQSSLQPTWC
uniref:Transmembrane protein n=1 Tax=Macrostomum lignano TaxID=282301 RepID=A0A1I8FQY8_9PLAT